MIKRLSGDGSAASAAGSGYEAPATNVGKAPDYSRTSCWLQIPEITKDVDTFFVYPTEYMGAAEDDPDYAPLDDSDMVQGAENDHIIMASAFEDSTNVFMPYYRQSSAYALKRAYDRTGDVRTALAGIPYEDITAALDYYFENYNYSEFYNIDRLSEEMNSFYGK